MHFKIAFIKPLLIPLLRKIVENVPIINIYLNPADNSVAFWWCIATAAGMLGCYENYRILVVCMHKIHVLLNKHKSF